MKFFNIITQISLWLAMVSCSSQNQEILTASDIAIIPEPAEMSMGSGCFEFNAKTCFVVMNQEQEELVTLLTDKFAKAANFELPVLDTAPKNNFVALKEDAELGEEAYRLKVAKNHIEITAGKNSGFLYALETLRQLLPPEIESSAQQPKTVWTIPVLEINDYPRYPWRGLMLDVSRHFFEKEYILQTLDRMALFKLNTLHLHLVDDQGWRIEIKKYPKLTEVGGFRVDQENKHWDARNKNEPGDNATYGGFYTQEEIKEIVAYAHDRGITVVPEIEMPAHVMSALAAYPAFSCFNDPIAVPSRRGLAYNRYLLSWQG